MVGALPMQIKPRRALETATFNLRSSCKKPIDRRSFVNPFDLNHNRAN